MLIKDVNTKHKYEIFLVNALNTKTLNHLEQFIRKITIKRGSNNFNSIKFQDVFINFRFNYPHESVVAFFK